MATQTFTVTWSDTARTLGSGDLDILGTPALLAWMEAVTVAEVAASLDQGQTSVGTRVELEHLSTTAVGSTVRVVADLAHRDGRLLRFAVAAQDLSGRLIASASLTRVVVDRGRFLARVPPPAPTGPAPGPG